MGRDSHRSQGSPAAQPDRLADQGQTDLMHPCPYSAPDGPAGAGGPMGADTAAVRCSGAARPTGGSGPFWETSDLGPIPVETVAIDRCGGGGGGLGRGLAHSSRRGCSSGGPASGPSGRGLAARRGTVVVGAAARSRSTVPERRGGGGRRGSSSVTLGLDSPLEWPGQMAEIRVYCLARDASGAGVAFKKKLAAILANGITAGLASLALQGLGNRCPNDRASTQLQQPALQLA